MGRARRRAVGGTAAAAVLLAPTLVLSGPAGAACAPPGLTVDRTLLRVGGEVRVSGTGWATDCDSPSAEPSSAQVSFVQDRRSAVLASVTADRQHRFTTVVTLPRWARPGPARVEAPPARPVQVTVMTDRDPFAPLPDRAGPRSPGRVGSGPAADAPRPADGSVARESATAGGDARTAAREDAAAPSDRPRSGAVGDDRLATTGIPTGALAAVAVLLIAVGAAATRLARD